MRQLEASALNHCDLKHLFIVFSIWSFITLCRPQDYLPFLAVLRPSLTFGIITFLIYLLNIRERQSIIQNGQFRLFICLVLVMIIGVPFSLYRSASLENVFNYASISMIFFILFYQIANTEEKIKRLLFAYCCGASIYATYILLFGKLSFERIAFGTMFDPNDTAFFVINFLAFNFIFMSAGNHFLKKIFVLINITISLVVLFKTGSRGGFIACMTVLAYLVFVKTKTVKISFLKRTIIMTIALLCLWSLSKNTERYINILDLSSDYNVTDETGRVAVWKIGMRLMLANPLTGVGVERFYEGVGRDRQERGLPSAKWQAAHNSFVQIGAETGIVGMILFILMSWKVFSITGHIIAQSKSENLIKISEMMRAGFIGHLVCAMFLSQAYSVYWVFYIALSGRMQRMLDKEQI